MQKLINQFLKYFFLLVSKYYELRIYLAYKSFNKDSKNDKIDSEKLHEIMKNCFAKAKYYSELKAKYYAKYLVLLSESKRKFEVKKLYNKAMPKAFELLKKTPGELSTVPGANANNCK